MVWMLSRRKFSFKSSEKETRTLMLKVVRKDNMTVRKKAMVRISVVVMSDQISMPMKLMNAMPMSPVMMNVMPKPRSGAGTCE